MQRRLAHACPDNWASIPLPYDNNAWQTGYAEYPGFQGKRQEQEIVIV